MGDFSNFKAYVVLIETSANQMFIFSSNKLRENVGASQLIYTIGTKFVLEAVTKITRKALYHKDNCELASNLQSETQNPPIESNDCKVEVMLSTSGKALLLVRNKVDGEQIIEEVTTRALEETPGAVVRGFISIGFDFSGSGCSAIHNAVGEVHQKIESLRLEIPAPESRFTRLPVVTECSASGLPAQEMGKITKMVETAPISSVVAQKRAASGQGWKRIMKMTNTPINESNEIEEDTAELARSIESLEEMEGSEWLAIIHADGNGLGQVFLNFDSHSGADTIRDYITQYRNFSIALDEVTLGAFQKAIKVFTPLKKGHKTFYPVVPLVLGGDDLTVITDGAGSVQFAACFLKEFEELSKENPDVSEIMGDVMGCCAGIAIVKPHFPFYQGYSLAESLLKSAKSVKQKIDPKTCSLDFYIHYDSSGSDLSLIRQNLVLEGEMTHLYAQPYVVTEQKIVTEILNEKETKRKITEQDKGTKEKWAQKRRYENLEELAKLLKNEEDDEKIIGGKQQHYLREGLFMGHKITAARLKLIKGRYNCKDLWGALLHPPKESGKLHSLFFQEDEIFYTQLIDAMDLGEIFPKENTASDENEEGTTKEKMGAGA